MKRLLALAALPMLGSLHAADSQRLEKPNLVFIMADDLGWRDLRCFGSTFHRTPHLDKLAARGVKFTQAYAANPLCSSHAVQRAHGLVSGSHGHHACRHPTANLDCLVRAGVELNRNQATAKSSSPTIP